MVKVLHVIDTLGRGGGAEHALYIQLPELAQRGVESRVVCLRSRQGPLAQRVAEEGTPVIVLDAANAPAQIAQLRRVIREFAPDLVHATLFDSCITSRLAVVGLGVPLLNSLVSTSYSPVRVERLGAVGWKRKIVQGVDRVTSVNVDHFHALTNAVGRDTGKALGISPERMTVIPRGRSRDALGQRTPERRARVRAQLGLADTDLVFVNVGRQDPPKGQPLLVDAFARVHVHFPHAHLVIAGKEGGASGALSEAVARSGSSGNIHLLGHRTDVADILSAADVFVFPSFYEGLGSALLEAMALELPIIASDAPAIQEVLDSGRAGLLVPTGDVAALAEAMVTLGTHADRRAELAASGYQRFSEDYELETVVDSTVRLYERLVGQAVVGGRKTTRPALHVISSNARRGAEVFAVELARALSEDYPGRVVALEPSNGGSTLQVDVLGPSWRSLGTMRQLRSEIRRSSVVVAHGSVTLPAVVLASLGTRVPLIYKNIGDPWYWATSLRRRWQTVVLLRCVDYVAALTESSAEAVSTCWRVPRAKIAVTSGGRDSTRYHPPSEAERNTAREALGLDPETKVLLYLGALSTEKRPELAIATALALPEVTLLMAGDGPMRRELDSLAAGQEDRVRLLGTRPDSVRLLHAADVVLLTSASEGLPGVLIEAGLSGLPCVAADVGFVKDVVVDGRTGVVVRGDSPAAFAEGVQKALRSRGSMGAAAREWCAERFDVGVAQRRWLNLMRRAAQRR